MKQKPSWAVWVATGFGLGYSPIASGTVGSLWGVLIVLLLFPLLPLWGEVLISIVLALAAIPVCDMAEGHFSKKDDGRIVADEYLTFPICMIGLPVSAAYWWVLVYAFLMARLLDIIKPPPAHQSQNLKGGLGIAIDDIISTTYCLLLNHIIFYTATRHFPGLVEKLTL